MREIVLKSIVNGVYVITARHNGEINGMTAAWVSQVSFDPVLLMISVSPMRKSHDMIARSGVFTINVLNRDQVDLAKHFGFRTGHEINKFEGINYTVASNGCPILPDVVSYINCKVIDTFTAGDHSLFIGQVTEAAEVKPEAPPLLFKYSDYF